jgi:hypothetical protein
MDIVRELTVTKDGGGFMSLTCTEQEADWAPETVWMLWKKRKIS